MTQKILVELTDKHKQLIGSTAVVFFLSAVTAFSSVSLEIKNKFAIKNKKKTPLIPANPIMFVTTYYFLLNQFEIFRLVIYLYKITT